MSRNRTSARVAASVRYDAALEWEGQIEVPEQFVINQTVLQWLGDQAAQAFVKSTGLRLSQITKVVLVQVGVRSFVKRPRIEVDRDPTPKKRYAPLEQIYARRMKPRLVPRYFGKNSPGGSKRREPMGDGYAQDKCQFEVHFVNAFGDADMGRIWVSEVAPSPAGWGAFTF